MCLFALVSFCVSICISYTQQTASRCRDLIHFSPSPTQTNQSANFPVLNWLKANISKSYTSLSGRHALNKSKRIHWGHEDEKGSLQLLLKSSSCDEKGRQQNSFPHPRKNKRSVTCSGTRSLSRQWVMSHLSMCILSVICLMAVSRQAAGHDASWERICLFISAKLQMTQRLMSSRFTCIILYMMKGYDWPVNTSSICHTEWCGAVISYYTSVLIAIFLPWRCGSHVEKGYWSGSDKRVMLQDRLCGRSLKGSGQESLVNAAPVSNATKNQFIAEYRGGLLTAEGPLSGKRIHFRHRSTCVFHHGALLCLLTLFIEQKVVRKQWWWHHHNQNSEQWAPSTSWRSQFLCVFSQSFNEPF